MTFNFQFVLAILLAALVLLVIRLLFSRNEESSLRDYPNAPEMDRRFNTTFASSSYKTRQKDVAPVSDSLGRVRVLRFNFEHFDAVPGPADPESFVDELILELYDSVSDFRWTATYVVGTPAGIRKLMDDERWSFFYATEIFVVRRYDLQTIREAVYGRIKEIHDQVALDSESPPLA